MLGGDRLRERSVQRCCVDELGAAADPALAQVPVGEEGELEWRDRALDRHVDQVYDQPSAVEALERTVQRLGAFGAVEGEDALVPAGSRQTFGLLGLQPHAGGDDEHVVWQHRSVVEQHLVALDPDLLDLVLMEDDAASQLAPARSHDLLELRQSERDEEQSGLVDVPVVAVDDVDLRLVGVEAAAQAVGGHRAARPAAEDHDLLPVHDAPPAATASTPVVPSRALDASRRTRCRPRSSGGGDTPRDSLQALELRVAELPGRVDRDPESARRRAVVVVDLDRHLAELPPLRSRVHHERRRDAGGERGGEQLVWRRSAPVTAEALWLVGDQAVPAVDHDLLPERAGDRAGCGSETHVSADSLIAARSHAIGACTEHAADNYAVEH